MKTLADELMAAGEPRKVFGKPLMSACRRKAQLNREWRRSLPKIERVAQQKPDTAGGVDPMDSEHVDRTIFLVSEWAPTGVKMLMRLAEGVPCTCCDDCSVSRPDLKAIVALTSILQDAIKLRIAQIDAKRMRKEVKETVQIGWAEEGDLS